MKKLLTVVLILAASCASKPEMSTAQIRAMQLHDFESTTYENVFRAFKSVLQDQGYQIKNQDLAGGLIVATVQKTDSMAGWHRFWGGNDSNFRTGEGYEVSVNLEKVGKAVVESRVSIQKLEQYNMGGSQGDVILDPEMYKNLYQQVRTEVERRKAQGKG